MELKCKRCKRVWVYKGKRKFYATCPICHTTVRIPKEEIKTNTVSETQERETDKFSDMGTEIG